MFETILGHVHNGSTFLFGVYISAAFLGVRMNKKNVTALFVFTLLCGVFFVGSFALFGEGVTEKLYPLIIHFPLVLFLTFYFKCKAAVSVLSVLTAYLCCQVSNWVGIAAWYITSSATVYYAVRILVTVLACFFLMCFVSGGFASLLQNPTKSIMIFALVPIVYYAFDYFTSVYTELLYSGSAVVVEFLGFVLCLAYILFVFLYFREYEEKCEAEQQKRLVEMQHRQAKKELDAIRHAEREISILRHDMRHYLSNVYAFVENGDVDKAKLYINELVSTADATSFYKYCKNEIVNMILSLYEEKFKENAVDFSVDVKLPEKNTVSDVDLTAILSNALENALQAVKVLDEKRRRVDFQMHVNDTKLLISIKNTFLETPEIRDGMPIAQKKGHGLGTASIKYVCEKLGGNCQFTVEDGMFILRVIL